jgi:hypothetical protein
MFKHKHTADKINRLMVDISDQLTSSLRFVHSECSEEEFQKYKRAVGILLGYTFTEVAGPIYERYPELMSDGLKTAHREYSEGKTQ